MSVKDLEIFGVIGYDGKTWHYSHYVNNKMFIFIHIEYKFFLLGTTLNGLKTHPNQNHLIYAMGNKVCILNWYTKKITFLHGHSNIVSTLAISPKGTYIGSGQINHIGFKGPVILWNFSNRTLKAKHELHKVCDHSINIIHK